MATKTYPVIDQFFAAQIAANESEETLKALRPQVEVAVKEMMRQQGKPKGWTASWSAHWIISNPINKKLISK